MINMWTTIYSWIVQNTICFVDILNKPTNHLENVLRLCWNAWRCMWTRPGSIGVHWGKLMGDGIFHGGKLGNFFVNLAAEWLTFRKVKTDWSFGQEWPVGDWSFFSIQIGGNERWALSANRSNLFPAILFWMVKVGCLDLNGNTIADGFVGLFEVGPGKWYSIREDMGRSGWASVSFSTFQTKTRNEFRVPVFQKRSSLTWCNSFQSFFDFSQEI